MKILFVTIKYPPYIGGAQTQTQLLARHLAKEHDVMVAIVANGEEQHDFISRQLIRLGDRRTLDKAAKECLRIERREYCDKGVNVRTIGLTFYEKLRIIFSGGSLVTDIIKRNLVEWIRDVDVVHCVKPDWLSFIVREASLDAAVPFTIAPYIHGRSVSPDINGLLASSEGVFALSETDKKRLVEIGVNPDNVYMMGVVPLVTTGGAGDKFRNAYGLKDQRVVLYVGRMIKYKGVAALLSAARLVWERCPDTRFVFIGPEGNCSTLFRRDCDPRILHLGCVSEAEKADALAGCDLLCMPSEYEILPSVYLEAWLYAKPVIGGPAYGLKELVEGNGAGLVSTQDPEMLSNSIVRLLSDLELRRRMGAAGRRLVNDRYSVESVTSRMLEAYRSAKHVQRSATDLRN